MENCEVNFGESLNELIMSRNMTPEELAEKVNVSRSTVYSWLQNKTDIRLSNLIETANCFEVSIEYLIGRSDDNSKKEDCKEQLFYDSLRSVMKERNVSTYKLIKTTPISSKHLYNWSHGKNPQLSTLITLSKVLDCTIDHLVGRE